MAAKSSNTTIKTQTKRTSKAKQLRSSIGAPSQRNQSSRKGKRAWRKNVDIEDVEEALEGMRAEERETGTSLQKIPDKSLFAIDLHGDPQVRKYQKFSAAVLTSTKILRQRTAVPAVFSRTNAGTKCTKRINKLSPQEKLRLLRIAKRPRRGPFNTVIDPTQPGEGSTLGEVSWAVKASGRYDPWGPGSNQTEGKNMDQNFGMDIMKKRQIKAPPVPLEMSLASTLPAVSIPHQGTSYNPPVDAHQELLRLANDEEEKRIKKTEELKKRMEKEDALRFGNESTEVSAEISRVPAGMILDIAEDGEEEENKIEEESVPSVKKMPSRKTKAQRKKVALLLAEKRVKTLRRAQKRLDDSIFTFKRLRKIHDRAALRRSQELASKQSIQLERFKTHGLAGKKFGKHRVPEETTDVQLGEDLSESLRGLKPEGNLFRDRFHRLQQKGAIEPRVLSLSTKRRRKTVEYEKHPWKRFV